MEHKRKAFDSVAKKLKRPSTPHENQRTEEKIVVCQRCGEVGHLTNQCKGHVPDYVRVEAQMEADLMALLASADCSGMEADDFGLFSTADSDRIPRDQSWKDGDFCCNCGRFGHVEEQCGQPSVKELERLYHKHSQALTKDEKASFASALREFCGTCKTKE
mgnify:CR=1 FL=1